jgi:hypothetical protein
MPSGSKDQIIGGGTPTDLPGTIGRLPVYTIGGLSAHISDSVFAQADSGKQLLMGITTATNDLVAGDSAVVIGNNALGRGPRNITIGDNAGQTVGSVAGADIIRIGTRALGLGANGISIGTDSNNGVDGVAIGHSAAVGTSGVAIGLSSTAQGVNSHIAIGKNSFASSSGGANIAIGQGANANVLVGTGGLNVAIGNLASISSVAGGIICIGSSAQANPGVGKNGAIAIGASSNASHGAAIALGMNATTTQDGEFVVGDISNAPVSLVSIRPAAGTPIRHRNSADGWAIRNLVNTLDIFKVDESATAGDVRLLVWDVTAATLKRVTVGVADSGGVGFKLLRVVN